MLLEHLTGSDGNVFEKSDDEYELMAGDFGVSVAEMSDVIDFCCRLELIFLKDGFIFSESLNERLAPVFVKRGKAKELSAQQLRASGKYVSSNAESSGVSVTEMPQSKVKEIRVEETKVEESEGAPDFEKEIFEDERFIGQLSRMFPNVDLKKSWGACEIYFKNLPRPPSATWMWRQKLQSWAENDQRKHDEQRAKTKGNTGQKTAQTSGSEPRKPFTWD
jgi:hypothetical protein